MEFVDGQNAQLGTDKRGGMTKLVIVLVMSVNYGKSGKKRSSI